jgi:hypothetical protein
MIPPHLWNFKLSFILSFKNFGNRDLIPSEFPLILHGLGMDIFWNYTLKIQVVRVVSYLPT